MFEVCIASAARWVTGSNTAGFEVRQLASNSSGISMSVTPLPSEMNSMSNRPRSAVLAVSMVCSRFITVSVHARGWRQPAGWLPTECSPVIRFSMSVALSGNGVQHALDALGDTIDGFSARDFGQIRRGKGKRSLVGDAGAKHGTVAIQRSNHLQADGHAVGRQPDWQRRGGLPGEVEGEIERRAVLDGGVACLDHVLA